MPEGENRPKWLNAKPDWAKGLRDCTDVLQWDSEQNIAYIGISGALALAIVDTGAHRTLLCRRTCEHLGLPLTLAQKGEYGTYRVPGEKEVK